MVFLASSYETRAMFAIRLDGAKGLPAGPFRKRRGAVDNPTRRHALLLRQRHEKLLRAVHHPRDVLRAGACSVAGDSSEAYDYR